MGISEIYASKGTLLAGKRILIGVTGSIAAIEVPHLIREILRYAGEPIVVLSDEALRFVALDALTWCMDKQPYTQISGKSEHIKWVSDPDYRVDLMIISPATANTISKIANGISDTPVTLAALAVIGAKIPLLIVPAAHTVLLENPVTRKNIKILKQLNVHFTSSPEEENKYKFPSLDLLLDLIFELIEATHLLAGKKFLITGGATREYLDDVRFLSNPSTGYSAFQIVKALHNNGAEVFFILGEGNTLDVSMVNFPVKIAQSTKEMHDLVHEELLKGYDGFISVAAVSDYSPKYRSGKISSQQEDLSIDLIPTPKIVKSIREKFPNLFIAAYKAEVSLDREDLIKRAEGFLQKYNLQMVCANWVGELNKGFASKTNELFVVLPDKTVKHLKGSKKEIGITITDMIIRELNKRGKK